MPYDYTVETSEYDCSLKHGRGVSAGKNYGLIYRV